ncbi:hypothetical protein [Paraglaciecola sp. L3A3]|uniref:hypothetical protein n=1 Tax=Paraglaciecola sp. L3A3 TaxID=2686358 RepID=UPI00131E1513|nr:hypothetical protein [Paraglaciecola sp. L3A3]
MKIDSQVQVSNPLLLNSAATSSPQQAESSSTLSIEQIKQKYDVTNISLKDIDHLVQDLKNNNLAEDGEWLMLATHGHQFRANLPGYGGGSNKINLVETLSNQLTMAINNGEPTDAIKSQLTLVKSLVSEDASGKGQDNQVSERNEQWLAQTMERLLDNRMGVDRDKLKEIDEKIRLIENDDSLSKADKAALIAALEQQKDNLLEQAAEQAAEKEKKLGANRAVAQNQKLLDALDPESPQTPSRQTADKDKIFYS